VADDLFEEVVAHGDADLVCKGTISFRRVGQIHPAPSPTFAPVERKPIFLLGIGVQKAGTTWMHRHLAQHPDTAFRHNFTKEFSLAKFSYRRQPSLLREPKRWWQMMRCEWDLREHHRKGVESTFFHPLLNQHRDKVMCRFASSGALNRRFLRWSRPTAEHPRGLIVGDITPSYPLVHEHQLDVLVKQLEKDFEVRALLMWRDPLERLESAMKHVTREEEKKGVQHLERFCRDGLMEGWAMYSDYVRTVETADALFADSFELVYEELFGPDGQTHLDAFHDWLGIRRVPGNFDVRVHGAGAESKALTPEQRATVRKFLQPQYNVMEERLGRERLASIWNL
jgi:hypothetical protein